MSASPASPLIRLTPLDGLEEAATCLRTLAHPHRLRMVQMLLQNSYTVGEVAEACGIPHHFASQHLGHLRDRGLLEATRDGRTVRYVVAQPALAGIIHCIEASFGFEECPAHGVRPAPPTRKGD